METSQSSICQLIEGVQRPEFHDAHQLLSLLSHFPGIVFASDRAGIITLQHGKGVAAMGMHPEDIIGRSVFDVFQHVPSILEGSRSALAGKAFTSTADFGKVVFEFWCEPTLDQSGELTGFVGAAIDITERQQEHEAFQKTSETLEAVIGSSPIAIVTLDLEGRVLTWNAAAERMHGWTGDEVLGKPLPVMPLESRNDVQQIQARMIREGGVADIERQCIRKDGSSVFVSLSGAPLHNAAGEVTGAVYLVMDITERKRAEAALQEALEQAKAASRAKSEFLANMSHEIRTPMSGVLGMTELALETNLTGEQRDYLNCVKSSAEALLNVLNDILDFSKIEAGKLTLNTEEFDLGAMIAETLRSLAVVAHQKGLELAYDIDSAIPEAVIGDPNRLRQVLLNLVGNSIKFTETGEVFLRVKPVQQDDKQVCLEFSVTDTGIGIPKDKQHEIFDAFTQADGSVTRRFGGTGLGLAISSQLVRMMRGMIWLDSEPGLGSTFYFTGVFGVAKNPLPPPSALESCHHLAVLAVDDNPTNCLVLERLLAASQMHPAVASDGRSALRLMKEAYDSGRPFRLVLIDAHMPGMDGFTLARIIKQDPELASTTIMMLSSLDHQEDLSLSQECGISASLVKPVGRTDLEKAILKALKVRNQADAPVSPPPDRPTSPLNTLRVLLVEDNVVNQTLVARLLEKRGWSVVLAADGQQALDACREHFFDVALMDIQMPHMDGFEACGRIREYEAKHGGHLPIIALTAHAMTGDRERCLQAGMDEYISKPIRSWELYEKIDALLKQP